MPTAPTHPTSHSPTRAAHHGHAFVALLQPRTGQGPGLSAQQGAFAPHTVVANMLCFEAALAQAQAHFGVIPEASAQTIVRACAGDFDAFAIVAASADSGSVAVPLVAALKAAVAHISPAAVAHTHWGSTSQDVMDTTLALCAAPVLQAVLVQVQVAATSLLAQAQLHAGTPVLARTLMQPASVTSFGLKCINWAAPLVRSAAALRRCADAALVVQTGGAAGTGLGALHGAAIAQHMAGALGLSAQVASGQTQRDDWARLASELAICTGALAKIGHDLGLLGQFEVAELREVSAGVGTSSAMPHKRNPVTSLITRVAYARTSARVGAMLGGLAHEHERALGAWQAELSEWPELLESALAAAHAVAQSVPMWQVDAPRMLANISAVAAQLPPEAAAQWFSPELANTAGELAVAQLPLLLAQLALLRDAPLLEGCASRADIGTAAAAPHSVVQ